MNRPQAKLTAMEDRIMRVTFRTTMLRAADIIEKITTDDVLEAQAALLAEGKTLEQVSRIDRASLAVAHLRVCAEGKATEYKP